MKLKYSSAGRRAFSLLEVMIAIAIFFVASFAILGLISSSLANVRRLQRPSVDASPVLARYAATNSLVEGTYSGSLGDPECSAKIIAITTGRRTSWKSARTIYTAWNASSRRPTAATKSFRT